MFKKTHTKKHMLFYIKNICKYTMKINIEGGKVRQKKT